jgi:hypothetical protein
LTVQWDSSNLSVSVKFEINEMVAQSLKS